MEKKTETRNKSCIFLYEQLSIHPAMCGWMAEGNNQLAYVSVFMCTPKKLVQSHGAAYRSDNDNNEDKTEIK